MGRGVGAEGKEKLSLPWRMEGDSSARLQAVRWGRGPAAALPQSTAVPVQ